MVPGALLHIFLVDEHEVVRLGVQAVIESTDDMELVGTAESVAGALLRIPTVRPDVAVIGYWFESGDGVMLCRELLSRCPGVKVLMLTASNQESVLVEAFLAGAQGVVNKSIRAVDLIATIRAVGAGRSLLDAAAALAVMARLRRGPDDPSSPFDALNEREHQVLELLGAGMTNRQIAERLNFAEKTVKNYVSRILTKLDVDSRTQAAVAFVTDTST